ncbi:MAG TPA: hypothetical protein PKI17_00850 [Syntrophomonas sp.]|nr:hypothetical protein [Syntrophomonas sp.]
MFYATGLFGFFMGFPVFHTFLSIPAGLFAGRWLRHNGADANRMHKAAKQSALCTTSVLAAVCFVSGLLALSEPSTTSGIQHMLGLPFKITPGMLLIILDGGALMLALGWGLTTEAVKRAFIFTHPGRDPVAQV